MAEMGFESIFFGRIDFQDWDQRKKDKNLEFNWRPFPNSQKSILGRVLHSHYGDISYLQGENFYCRSIYCKGSLSESQLKTLKRYQDSLNAQTRTSNTVQLVGNDFHLWKQAEKDFQGIHASNSYL